jgi:hypothetical protein
VRECTSIFSFFKQVTILSNSGQQLGGAGRGSHRQVRHARSDNSVGERSSNFISEVRSNMSDTSQRSNCTRRNRSDPLWESGVPVIPETSEADQSDLRLLPALNDKEGLDRLLAFYNAPLYRVYHAWREPLARVTQKLFSIVVQLSELGL